MECACCGKDRDPRSVAALRCHEDVKVCRDCIGWLQRQVQTFDVTPSLPVTDMDQSVAFYGAAGFDVHVYEGGGYAFVRHDDQSVFDLGLEADIDPAANKAGCYLIVADVTDWHATFTRLGYPVTEPQTQDYGMVEFTLTDPSGNHLRFGHNI